MEVSGATFDQEPPAPPRSQKTPAGVRVFGVGVASALWTLLLLTTGPVFVFVSHLCTHELIRAAGADALQQRVE